MEFGENLSPGKIHPLSCMPSPRNKNKYFFVNSVKTKEILRKGDRVLFLRVRVTGGQIGEPSGER